MYAIAHVKKKGIVHVSDISVSKEFKKKEQLILSSKMTTLSISKIFPTLVKGGLWSTRL